MPLDDETPVNSFNLHTTLLLGCTDFTQGFRHSNLDFNPSMFDDDDDDGSCDFQALVILPTL